MAHLPAPASRARSRDIRPRLRPEAPADLRRGFLICKARWQSGHAAACKAVYAGSIPTLASIATGPIPRVLGDRSSLLVRSRAERSNLMLCFPVNARAALGGDRIKSLVEHHALLRYNPYLLKSRVQRVEHQVLLLGSHHGWHQQAQARTPCDPGVAEAFARRARRKR